MLKINAFKNAHTVDDIRAILELSNSVYEEQSDSDMPIVRKEAFRVVGTEFDNLTYALSASKEGVLGKNFFVYGEDLHGFHGLAYANQGSTDVVSMIPPEYSSFHMAHQECWYAMRPDTTYDLFIYGKKVKSDIVSTDILNLGGILYFLQIDTAEHRSLVCMNRGDLTRGVFCPKSLDDFRSWFDTNVARLGYAGQLDMCRVSDLFRVYYEVQSCIFCNGSFEPISV